MKDTIKVSERARSFHDMQDRGYVSLGMENVRSQPILWWFRNEERQMIDKFIPALICITAFVLLGVAVCRASRRYDIDPMCHSQEPQPIGYESAHGAALEEFKARKAAFVAAAMKAERERLVTVYVNNVPTTKPASEIRGEIKLLLTKDQRKEWGL
jgi:hypothetical protein